jgi:serine/threonine protein kinase
VTVTRPAGAGPDPLGFLAPAGFPVLHEAVFGADASVAGSPQLVRSVVLGQGWTVQQRRLPARQADPALRAALEDEVRAALMLIRRYGEDKYPAALPRIAGYDTEAEEPFVLYERAPGLPLSEAIGQFTVKQRRLLGQGLISVLRLLEGAGLVHRAVTPENVLWDGESVRLSSLAAAVPAGSPRTGIGDAPWASPEQLAGTGRTDSRDDVWSAAQVLYHATTGRPVNPAGPPKLLSAESALSAQLAGTFAVHAAQRPELSKLLSRLNCRDPLLTAPQPPDPLAAGRRAFDALVARKKPDEEPQYQQESAARPARRGRFSRRPRENPRTAPESGKSVPEIPVPGTPHSEILCPNCLDTLRFDRSALYRRDSRMRFEQVDLSSDINPLRMADAVRTLFQACTNTGGLPPHYLPAEYLSHGKPLTVALVGASGAGKTHLLASMMSEIDARALEPYGVSVRSANTEWHNAFMRRRVNPLRSGELLPSTPETQFVEFEDALLFTRHGVTRPVAFFDVSGENLVRSDATLRFLAGVDALMFVVDPVRALRSPQAQSERARLGLGEALPADSTFGTVLDRVPPRNGRIELPTALAISKCDLLRFEPPVDRWLRARPDGAAAASRRAESRDAYAFLSLYADRPWLRPADECANCTLHFVSAIGGPVRHGSAAHGVRPSRVLEPLLSLLEMCGVIDAPQAAPESVA